MCSWPTARTDIVAGVAIAGLLIQEGMAYAGIAGVPPQMGLYSALIGMFVYAIFGTSRQLAVTSTSSSAAMLAALVAPLAAVNSSRYMLLVSAVTIAAGFLFLLGGVTDVRTLKYYARLRTGSVWVALAALLGVLQMGILKGLIFAVDLTLIALMHKLTSPQDSVLGRLKGSENFVDGRAVSRGRTDSWPSDLSPQWNRILRQCESRP
jgi:MFS superfamily sulfate permease-like transporter